MKSLSAHKSPPIRTAVAYARYSSAGQRDVSIEQQLQDIRAYAGREGYTLLHEYADHAKSGYHNVAARSQFLSMLSAAEKGLFDTVIVWKVDRFGRNREESAIFKAQLRRAGVNVLYAMEPIPTGAAGVLTEGMLEAIAEWYSRNLAENVNRGMRDNAMKCLHNGAPIFGYRRGPDGHLVIQPDEAATVRMIFSRYNQGVSCGDLAQELNAAGMKTPRGCAWSGQAVLRFLSNERYMGTYIWSDIRIPGGIPAIVTPEEWEKAQRMRHKTTKHYEKNAVDYLLAGKVFCGHCGAAMVGDSGTSHTGALYMYYTCQNKKARKGCHKKSLRKDDLENTVIDFVINRCLNGAECERIADAIVQAQKAQAQKSPLAKLEADLKDTEKKIDNVNSAIEQGIWTDSTVVRLKSLESTAASLRASIEQLRFSQGQLLTKDRVMFFLNKMSGYDFTDPNRRRQLIETFVNAVYVYDDYLRIVINAIEGNIQIPLASIEENEIEPLEGSDFITSGVPIVTHPNFRVIIYTLKVKKLAQ